MNSVGVWGLCVVGIFGLLVGGCVTTESRTSKPAAVDVPALASVPLDQIQIQDRFEAVTVTDATLVAEYYRCLPQLSRDGLPRSPPKLPLPSGTVMVLSHPRVASSLIVSGASAICLQQSAAGYPIFAGEAFLLTANPGGVPPTVTNGWYAQIARRLAEKGLVKVAYVFPSGNAAIATYWVAPLTGHALYYFDEIKKPGTWEGDTYDFRFTSPSLRTFISTRHDNLNRRIDFLKKDL